MTRVQTAIRRMNVRDQWVGFPNFIDGSYESVGYTHDDKKGNNPCHLVGPLAAVMAGLNLKRTLNRAWRLLATGLSFSLFGIAGLITGLLFFPLLFFVIR